MSALTIDWSAIRPLNGSRADGFEELCAQLARAESPPGSHFVRKGTPDAGVECYAVLGNGTEWGWQSKYFETLGDSQWSQLDNSARTAIQKHPQLVRYFVCVPLDLPDARIAGQKSARERWDDHAKKWSKWAAERGMTAEFTCWGSHELLTILSKTEHVGRVRFWFDVRGFDKAWFSSRLDEALRTAGPRYTPPIHVDLPIAREFDAFGRTERFFDSVKMHARGIRRRIRDFSYSDKNDTIDEGLDAATKSLRSCVEAVCTGLADIQYEPIGYLPFQKVIAQVAAAEKAAVEVEQFLSERERTYEQGESRRTDAASRLSYGGNRFRDRRFRLYRLTAELSDAQEALRHADYIASPRLMLLRGAAGTGKTHLLCDVARQRLDANRPTVLLLGQRFVSKDAPWTQALQQMDLTHLSAEEFVGALEAAAQAAGLRALVLIDAINEGEGRVVWPGHMAAFLVPLERSPWVSIVFSVRSSYEGLIVPTEIKASAAVVTHHGFLDHEYDAARTFFLYYGLELPSTPLLSPEFSNPFFLKTLCQGLHERGERRLPRGFHGVTAVFELYLSAINDRLARSLDFDPRTPLVRRALETMAKAMVDSEQRWLTLEKAREIANSLLPDRGFERSLYRGLVVEGVLVEEAASRQIADREEIVFIGYERLADHLAAKILLDSYVDDHNPAAAFAAAAGLAFLVDKTQYVSPGLLEALCIQIAERTGQELIGLAPAVSERWGVGEAFRQSIVWRASSAFSDSTRELLNKLCLSEDDLHDTLDVLVTVATLPGHPFNATFLDRRLRQDPMADRDAWWNTYLHQAWGRRSAVDRLVDWASLVKPDVAIEDESVDLCATSLAWMLTTSNRFLRDRATTSLVCLLTGRLPAVGRLVERFADVDDPYVVERIHAVAYATVMRSHDALEVGRVADRVYACIFAGDAPPPHILLRDYARGVVERALYLGSKIEVDVGRIRPPYKSEWPSIPTEEDIKPFLPDWSQGSYDSGDTTWARNRIGSSVMDDDFARYVIGTNSSPTSSNWLSLRLEEPGWNPPQPPEAQLRALSAEFSEDERRAWESFQVVEEELQLTSRSAIDEWLERRTKDSGVGSRLPALEALEKELENPRAPELLALEPLKAKRNAALSHFNSTLTPEHQETLERIRAIEEAGPQARQAPRFALRQLQRYILRRVFDLGWTTERFGHFDRRAGGEYDRAASKAERIGKKYQWIAYHEIMAFVADHFQYREQFRDEHGDTSYNGPWQEHFRDIDPSCTMRSLPGGTSWDGHSISWWGAAPYNRWGSPDDPKQWALRYDDLPNVPDLLVVTNPSDKTRWVNAEGYFNWQQQPPADWERTDVDRRDLWFLCTAYLIRAKDAERFLRWAEDVDFWGRWVPKVPQVYQMFLGEYGWAPASRYFQHEYFGDAGWKQPDQVCPVSIRTAAFEYLRESGGFDCSIDDGYTLRLPATEFLTGMGLHWSGSGADFVDLHGQLVVFDPTAHGAGPSALLLRQDRLQEFLMKEDLTICWAVLGEKRILGPSLTRGERHASLRMSGAYALLDDSPVGFLKCLLDDRWNETKPAVSTLAVIRTGT